MPERSYFQIGLSGSVRDRMHRRMEEGDTSIAIVKLMAGSRISRAVVAYRQAVADQ